MAVFFFSFFTLFHLSLTFFRPEVPFKALWNSGHSPFENEIKVFTCIK